MSVPPSPRPAPLHSSKFKPPGVAGPLVPRARLHEWLTAAEHARLVLVRAPAGFGKTTLMLQWMHHLQAAETATAWLGLSEADNDTGRFLTYLAGALRQIDPSLDPGPTGDAFGNEASTASLLNLLEWVASRDVPFALFLDEFEIIRNPAVHDIVRQTLHHLPEGSLVLIATRELPQIGVGRLRALRQLVDIGLEDLRFSPDETARFLRHADRLVLDDEDLYRLQRCTEGWVAGLQLAALALTGREDGKAFIRSLTGSHAHIADYLAEDVLARQPEEVRDFLLKTSILERLCGPLCDAVTDRTDGYEMLAHLERANLFLVPLDDERRWYRYHNLFAQFLRSRLDRGVRELVAALHRSAAAWLSAQGVSVGAAAHLLAAGDTDEAARLMAGCARDLVKLGRVRTVSEWVEALPAEALNRHPDLRLAYCWALCARRCYAEAIANLDALPGPGQQESLDPAAHDELLALRPTILLFEGRIEECHQAAVANLPNVSSFGTFGYGVLQNVLAFCLTTSGQFDEAESLLHHALRSHVKAGTMFATVYAKCFQGWGQMVQGRLGSALEHYRLALARAREASPGYSVPGALAATFLADALYERDELDEAERLLSEHFAFIPEGSTLDIVLLAYLTLTRIRFARGQEAEALHLLEEAEAMGRDRGAARVAATVRLERVRLALQKGDLAAAEATFRTTDDRPVWQTLKGRCLPANDPESPQVSRLRLQVRRGEAHTALAGLRSELSRAKASGRHRQALKLRVLTAQALDASGEKRAALRALGEAVQLSAPEGFVRTFVDEGPGVAQLLGELGHAGCAAASHDGYPSPSYIRQLLARFGSGASATSPEDDAGQGGLESAPTEDLTDREISILQMLARGLSNQSLADHLFVSVPTVKFHLHNINRKLGATNRTEAVAKARRLHLIH